MRKEDAALEREILVDQNGDPVFFRLSQTVYPIAYLLGRKPKRESVPLLVKLAGKSKRKKFPH